MMEEGRVILAGVQKALMDFDMDGTHKLVREGIEAGIDPVEIVENGLSVAMREVGERFGRGEAYLPELMQWAQIMKSSVEILRPVIEASQRDHGAEAVKVVLGTVQGDIHDIGQNIVHIILETAGFEVVNLGVDVSVETFIQAAMEHRPAVLGLSALLTTTLPQMETVILALKEAGIRDKVKVIVGGSTVSQEYADEIGADAYGIDAVDGLEKVRAFIS
jgi:corrinoid protein of di/trimethylamine methyltransferase